MRLTLSIITFLVFFSAYAQDDPVEIKEVDSLYREDQFYLNFTYNKLQNVPKGFSQTKFSPGFCVGFLRDMPINKTRTIAIAAGLGYSLTVFKNNLYQYNDGVNNNYELVPTGVSYSKDKTTLHFIELPIEFRWRNSTYQSHKFWRVYSGFKLSYLINDTYKFQNSVENSTIKNNPDFNKLQYGCYLTVGWNTFNIYAYYSLNSMFKTTEINGQTFRPKALNLGFQFYIL